MMLLLLSMMRWTNPSQPTSSKLKVESKFCFFEFFFQFQSGIGPPPQSRLLQKMSGKKSTNRVRRLSFRKIDTTEIIFSAALQERREVGADRRGE